MSREENAQRPDEMPDPVLTKAQRRALLALPRDGAWSPVQRSIAAATKKRLRVVP